MATIPRPPGKHFAPRIHSKLPSAPYTTAPQASEAQALGAIWRYLQLHPKVAFIGRFNAGGAVDGRGQYVRFCSIPGFPDLAGMLKGGRALYVEVKRPAPSAGKLTEAQQIFLEHAASNGALAFVARSIEDVESALASSNQMECRIVDCS